jgi:heat shock protein HslJ
MYSRLFHKPASACIIVFSAMLLICSCEDPVNSEELIGEWNLSKVEDTIQGKTMFYPDTLEKRVSIVLTDSSFVLLNGYCNSGSGYYEADNEIISFSDLSMTEMGCLLNNWEVYLYLLYHAETYTITQDHLRIKLDNEMILYFTRKD